MRGGRITENPPPVHFTNGTWETFSEWQVRVNGVVITVPQGYRTDLASVPYLLRGLPGFNTYELGGVGPPLLHDVIYGVKGRLDSARPGPLRATPPTRFTRRAADRLFRTAMRDAGVGRFRSRVAWVMVRLFGWVPWPPSRTTWRNVATRAGHTVWQASGAVGAAAWLSWPSWTVPLLAAVLSAIKTLVQRTPMAEWVKGVIYR